MTMDQWVTLVQNVGLPIVIIFFGAWYFVKPLGGTDGLVAKFFISQATNSAKQTELMQEQRQMVADLSRAIGTSATLQTAHFSESTRFFRDSHAEQCDLMRIHGLIIRAQQLEFENQQAKELLREADEIVQGYLRRERHSAAD